MLSEVCVLPDDVNVAQFSGVDDVTDDGSTTGVSWWIPLKLNAAFRYIEELQRSYRPFWHIDHI